MHFVPQARLQGCFTDIPSRIDILGVVKLKVANLASESINLAVKQTGLLLDRILNSESVSLVLQMIYS